MPSTIINFSHKINTSVQTGDIAYCLDSDPANVGGFGTAGESNIQLIGDITNIDRILNTITCTEPYIFFGKNESVNTSGVKGYYANAKFVNNNYVESAELFAVSSEVKESSK